MKKFTTIVIDKNNVIYDLGQNERPGAVLVINARTCSLEELEKLKEKYKGKYNEISKN